LAIILDYVQRVKSFSRNARLFLIAGFVGALYHSVYGVIGNLYILQAGHGESFLGLMFSVSSLASVIFSVPAGLFSDHFGRRRSLLGAALVAAFAQVAIVLWPTAEIIVASTLVGGAAGAVMMVSSSPFLVENSNKEERSHLFSVNSAIWTVSGIVGSFLGGALPMLSARVLGVPLASLEAYRAALLLSAIFLAISIVPYYLVGEERRIERPEGSRKRIFHFPDGRLCFHLLLPEFLMSFGAGLIIPFLNVYFSRHLRASVAEIGVVFSVTSLTTTIAVLGAPILGAKYGKVRATTLTRLLSVPMLLVIALTTNLWVASVAAWIRSALMNMSQPLVGSLHMEVLGAKERATMSSLLSMIWALAWGLGASLGGHLMKTYSYSLPYFLTAVLYVLSALAFDYFLAPRERELELRTAPVMLKDGQTVL